MADNEKHECSCGGACRERFVKVEKKNEEKDS